MPYVTLHFSGKINTSLQIGDWVYHSTTPTTSGGFSITDDNNGYSGLTKVGQVTGLTQDESLNKFAVVVVYSGVAASGLASGKFILFSKNNIANTSSMLGYYGSAKFENNSKFKAELFSTTCNIVESSK